MSARADMTAVSLFAGIGGFDLALDRAGVRTVAAVEIDPACRGVLRRHFPKAQIFNDVREVAGDQLRAAGFVPGRGVLCGGFPCQDLSVAGRRAGLGGARSGLFWEIMRLADELSPRWLLLENVPGLLSAVCSCPGGGACVANGRAVRCGEWRAEPIPESGAELTGENCPACDHGLDVHDAGNFCAFCNDACAGPPDARNRKVFIPYVPHAIKGGACRGGCMGAHGDAMGAVLGALGERGYGFAYRVLDAQFFGVPQRRNRVFVVGCLGDPAGPVEVLLEPEGGEGDPSAGGQARARAASATHGGDGVSGVVGALTRGCLTDYDDNTAQAGQLVAHAITAREGKGPDSDCTSGFIVASTLQGGGENPATAARQDVAGTLGSRVGGSRTTDLDGHGAYIASTLQGGGRRGYRVDAEGAAGGHLIAATLTAGVSSGEGVRPPGRRAEDDVNLVVPLQASNWGGNGSGIGEDGSPSFTLDTDGSPKAIAVIPFDAAQITHPENRSNPQPLVAAPMAFNPQTGGTKGRIGYGEVPTALQEAASVRRLTPMECERLQGFPDEWTRWLDDGSEQSDSARYRQAGNAVAVPVVEWIARRVVAVDQANAASGAA